MDTSIHFNRNMKNRAIRTSRFIVMVILILFSLSVLSARGNVGAETIRYIDNKVLVEGKLTGISDKSVALEGKKYNLDENYTIVDMEENALPFASLKNAEIVRLEVSHGYVQKIYIIILPQ